jgi:MFS transporter, FSR family, fosmidomycin resistance protein
VLGKLADQVGVNLIYQICAFLPLIGLLAAFLPDVHRDVHRPAVQRAVEVARP